MTDVIVVVDVLEERFCLIGVLTDDHSVNGDIRPAYPVCVSATVEVDDVLDEYSLLHFHVTEAKEVLCILTFLLDVLLPIGEVQPDKLEDIHFDWNFRVLLLS